MNTLAQNLSDAHGILAMLGWDDHTYTHLSARLPDGTGFYLTPFGPRFEEIMPYDLLKLNFQGERLQGSPYWMNQTGHIIHSAIYQHCADIKAVFHLHTPETVAVSALAEGLLPLSQWALHFYGRLSYHNYDSLALNETQGALLAQDLSKNRVLFLRHHGIITAGATIEEALFYTYHLHKACEAQCKLLAMNAPYVTLAKETCEKTVGDLLSFETHLGQRDWQAWVRKLRRWRKQQE